MKRIAPGSRADRTFNIAYFGGRGATLVSETTSAKDVDTLLLCVDSFWLLLRAGFYRLPNMFEGATCKDLDKPTLKP